MHKVAVITGAAGALGTAIADVLATRGWSLVLTDLPTADLEAPTTALQARYPASDYCALPADLSNPAEITGLISRAIAWKGRVDSLINNAAQPTRAGISDISVPEWERVMNVNLRAPMLLMQALAPFLRVQGTGGSIVNVASRVWATGGPAAYVAAKAGLVGLTRSAAFEFGPIGVRVNAVAPSAVATRFTSGSRSMEAMDEFQLRLENLSALKRAPEIREIATSVAYLAGEDSSFVTGEVLHVCGGLQLAPVP